MKRIKPKPKDKTPDRDPDDYDPQKDLAGSINEAFAAIRDRKAAGGDGWNPK